MDIMNKNLSSTLATVIFHLGAAMMIIGIAADGNFLVRFVIALFGAFLSGWAALSAGIEEATGVAYWSKVLGTDDFYHE